MYSHKEIIQGNSHLLLNSWFVFNDFIYRNLDRMVSKQLDKMISHEFKLMVSIRFFNLTNFFSPLVGEHGKVLEGQMVGQNFHLEKL